MGACGPQDDNILWTTTYFGLNRCAVFGRFTFQTFAPVQMLIPVSGDRLGHALRNHGRAACSTFHFAKGAHHDTPSATHDRRKAGANSPPKPQNTLSATGILFRTPLQPIARGLGPGGDPSLSGLLDQKSTRLNSSHLVISY